ncbi:hypothetical protein SAMN04489801_0968 [Pseudomonas mandelii]|uniref:Uncharacterized protein n=1 Tax=Pseudomonas mandelii TaxID=75612 RepID=A0ABY0VDX3_9PSED|nr:hypothetical protein SAMN04489801_0968 [Pseudomonas mandelii]
MCDIPQQVRPNNLTRLTTPFNVRQQRLGESPYWRINRIFCKFATRIERFDFMLYGT